MDLAKTARVARNLMLSCGAFDVVLGAYMVEIAMEGRFDIRQWPDIVGLSGLCIMAFVGFVSAAVFVAATRAEGRRLEREAAFD